PLEAPFLRSGNAISLRIGVKRWRWILDHNSVTNPFLPGGHRPRVYIIFRRVFRKCAPFFDGNQVVQVRRIIVFLHRRRNLVVRLGQNAIEGNALWVVAECAEGVDLGHGLSGEDGRAWGQPPVYATRAVSENGAAGLRTMNLMLGQARS